MSTTFEVYSKTSFIPSFQDILDLSTIKLQKFLDDFKINYKPQISVRLNSVKSHDAKPLNLSNGYYSTFSRGRQPAIIHLAYGIIAASLAYLTKGFIYSDDAWDYKRFPATASEFFSWYFRPELAIDTRHKEWATECIKLIPEQYE